MIATMSHVPKKSNRGPSYATNPIVILSESSFLPLCGKRRCKGLLCRNFSLSFFVLITTLIIIIKADIVSNNIDKRSNFGGGNNPLSSSSTTLLDEPEARKDTRLLFDSSNGKSSTNDLKVRIYFVSFTY